MYDVSDKQKVILEEIKRIEHVIFCIENGYGIISFNDKKIYDGRPTFLTVIPNNINIDGELKESILVFYNNKHDVLIKWLKELEEINN